MAERKRAWERGASPAAAAAVSRALADAGVTQAVELQRGVESEGYVAELAGGCVKVEYVPGFLDDDDPKVAAGLTRCAEVLEARGYEVERRREKVARPGGWRDGELLEVRR